MYLHICIKRKKSIFVVVAFNPLFTFILKFISSCVMFLFMYFLSLSNPSCDWHNLFRQFLGTLLFIWIHECSLMSCQFVCVFPPLFISLTVHHRVASLSPKLASPPLPTEMEETWQYSLKKKKKSLIRRSPHFKATSIKHCIWHTFNICPLCFLHQKSLEVCLTI